MNCQTFSQILACEEKATTISCGLACLHMTVFKTDPCQLGCHLPSLRADIVRYICVCSDNGVAANVYMLLHVTAHRCCMNTVTMRVCNKG